MGLPGTDVGLVFGQNVERSELQKYQIFYRDVILVPHLGNVVPFFFRVF